MPSRSPTLRSMRPASSAISPASRGRSSRAIDGARQAIAVGIACAIVGVIIGVLTLTGAASNFAGFVLDVGLKSLFLSLFLTMAVCLVLGMGIPTIPNYIITSAIAAPSLKLGVPLIVSHMFVFYFGIMADLTPPVALAAFAAASIAKASPMKIGWKATHIAIAGFTFPTWPSTIQRSCCKAGRYSTPPT